MSKWVQKSEETSSVQTNIYIRNPITCTCENLKYLGRIIADSVMPSFGVGMANLLSRRDFL